LGPLRARRQRAEGRHSRADHPAELIDAATDDHVWAERYDHEIDDIFTVQDAEAHDMARRAVELDDRDAEAHTILGMAALFIRRFDDSVRRLETLSATGLHIAEAVHDRRIPVEAWREPARCGLCGEVPIVIESRIGNLIYRW
jgi:Flp pilus assembly protein TadD